MTPAWISAKLLVFDLVIVRAVNVKTVV